MAGPFVGRSEQLSALRARLARVVEGEPCLVLVEGPAGIGKTSLVGRFLADHPETEVLTGCGEEGEAGTPFGLLDHLFSDTQVSIPRPATADAPTAGSLLVDGLGEVQMRIGRPLILVVDDVQWADAPSLQALAFALRRLRADRVLTIAVTREADDPALPEGLRRLLLRQDTLRLSLAGLTAAEVSELVDAHAGPLPPAAVMRLFDHTGGNPLYLKALLEQVPMDRLMSSASTLPAPLGYSRLIERQLTNCTEEAQALVNSACVLGNSSPLHTAARLADLKHPLSALEEAVGQGLLQEVLEQGGSRVRFPHPMVRATVYAGLGPVRRNSLHVAAAEQASTSFGRLQHLVHAAWGPDDALAGQLSELAHTEAAARRWGTAALLLRDAARLACGERDRLWYSVKTIEALLWEGRRDEAQVLFDELPGDSGSPAYRYARALLSPFNGEISQGEALLRDAWESCDTRADPELAAHVAGLLSSVMLSVNQGLQAAEWAGRAMSLWPRRTSEGMLRYVQMAGCGLGGDIARGLALAADLPKASLVAVSDVDLLCGRGLLWMWAGELDEAARDLREAIFICRGGPMMLRIVALLNLGLTEYALGSWEQAAQRLESAASLVDDAGLDLLATVHACTAHVQAARGQDDRALWHLARLPDVPVTCGTVLTEARRARAFLALLQGQPGVAADELTPLLEADAVEGLCQPMTAPWRDLLAEAFIGLGQLDQAEETLTAYDKLTAECGPQEARAAGWRIRGMLLAARRDVEAAERAFQEGLVHTARVHAPFEQARLRLALGQLLRRTGRRACAARELHAAHTILTGLGATPLIRLCERELAACGIPGTAGRRPTAAEAGTQLTPQELAVGRLAAGGLTNRQVARELVISIKTVEYHLGNVYAKLGISSRTGLMTRLPPGPFSAG
ncbi:AAA family ATPase [Streptomyces sp. W16]|uniref:helix-turn-helix transcriptional regulator n=1 Tax=Streptomyces sp. W16 TaxID=3076631 RepID=UPI00295BDAE9|nr:AAA family ATPase [Streptomyces sp. W16]MDV9170076.1 AAA family ATPase [Streptomyces sp. W16]